MYQQSEIVLKVRRPGGSRSLVSSKKDTIVIGLLNPYDAAAVES